MIPTELTFLFSDDFSNEEQMQALSQLGPNSISEADLSNYLDKGLQMAQVAADQMVFIFKANAQKLAKLIASRPDIANSSRVALTVCMLTGELDDKADGKNR